MSQILDAPVLNYAVGGAQTGALNQFAGLPGFTQETAIFLSGATPPGTIFPANTGFQEGDLLALSIGINDGRAFYQANPAGTIAQAQAAASTSVTNATNNLNLLVAAGAPTISYVALNAGLTPDVLTNPTAQAARQRLLDQLQLRLPDDARRLCRERRDGPLPRWPHRARQCRRQPRRVRHLDP